MQFIYSYIQIIAPLLLWWCA